MRWQLQGDGLGQSVGEHQAENPIQSFYGANSNEANRGEGERDLSG